MCQRLVCQKREFAARWSSCEVSRCDSKFKHEIFHENRHEAFIHAGFDTGFFARGGGGGETIFFKCFWIFSDSRTDEFSYNNFSNSTIDQFKYSHFVCLPVYHIH